MAIRERERNATRRTNEYESPPPPRDDGWGLGHAIVAFVALLAVAALAIAIWEAVAEDDSAGPE